MEHRNNQININHFIHSVKWIVYEDNQYYLYALYCFELFEIPSLLQNQKFLLNVDPETVGHLAAECFTLLGDGIAKETQNLICEMLLR